MKIEHISVGMMVRYHPVIGEGHDGETYEVRHVGKLCSGHDVVWLKGKSGCVSVDAISTANLS